MKKEGRRHEKAKGLMKSAGYARGGAAKGGNNEPDDCPTEDNPQCKKKGGAVTGTSGASPDVFPLKGESPRKRLDKRPRLATGGGVDMDSSTPKKKSGGKTEVNVIIAGDKQPPVMPPVMPPAMAGAPAPAPMPPGAGMPAPRPPGPPMMGRPPGAMKRGGAVADKGPKYPIKAGAGGGEGRLEKAAAASKTKKGPKK